MTVEERLLFIRAGYSAKDIAEFEAVEKAADPTPGSDKATADPAADPEPEPEPASDPKPAPAAELEKEPAWAAALRQSIDALAKAQQASNARFDDMGDPMSVQEQAEEALANYLTGNRPESKTASKTGGKRK